MSAQTSVIGYNVYRADGASGPFVKLNTGGLFTNTRYHDFEGLPSHVYMVRAVKLEQTPTGTYHNASQGTVALDL